jgi:hypothetical protein
MIIDKIRRLFGLGRFQSLLLEVFAIFLGITGSFAVEEWRETRQADETFRRFLEAIYYDVLREQASLRYAVYSNNQTIAILNTLLAGEHDSIPGDRLLAMVEAVFSPWSTSPNDSSFRALAASDLAMPFDDTMQILTANYSTYSSLHHGVQQLIADHNRTASQVLSEWGTVSNRPTFQPAPDGDSMVFGPRLDRAEYAGIRQLFFDGETFLPAQESVAKARQFLQLPTTRQLLAQEIERVMQASDLALAIRQTGESFKSAIRARLPDLRLSVRTLALVGSATPGGWAIARATPLHSEQGGGDWWSAELTLGDGMAKFIANGDFGTSWGVEPAWAIVSPGADPTHYLGDPAAVFPTGVAAFDGQNLPISAGRYRVRFNTHTFEYRFEAIKG